MSTQVVSSVGAPPPPAQDHDPERHGPKDRLLIQIVLYRTRGAHLNLVHTLTRIPFPRIGVGIENLEQEGLVTTWQTTGFLDRPYSDRDGTIARAAKRLAPPGAFGSPTDVPLWARTTLAQLTDTGERDPQLLEALDLMRRERAREAREFRRGPLRYTVRRVAGALEATIRVARRRHDD